MRNVVYDREYNKTHREKMLIQQNQRLADNWALITMWLGDKCEFCGRTERLTVDHIDNNGTPQDRWMVSWSLKRIIARLEKGGLRILCKSCNSSRSRKSFLRGLRSALHMLTDLEVIQS